MDFREGFYIPKLRNIVKLRGLNLIISRNQNAQDQFPAHARAEDGDLRNSGKPGVVAKNPPALSLHPLSGARHRSQHCGDGSAAFRDPDLVDVRANYRSRPPGNSFSPSKGVDKRNACGLDVFCPTKWRARNDFTRSAIS